MDAKKNGNYFSDKKFFTEYENLLPEDNECNKEMIRKFTNEKSNFNDLWIEKGIKKRQGGWRKERKKERERERKRKRKRERFEPSDKTCDVPCWQVWPNTKVINQSDRNQELTMTILKKLVQDGFLSKLSSRFGFLKLMVFGIFQLKLV